MDLSDLKLLMQEAYVYVQLFAPVYYVLVASLLINLVLLFKKPKRLQGNRRVIKHVKAYKFKTKKCK